MPWANLPSSAGIKVWTYEQDVAISVWTIYHGLNNVSSVDIMVYNEQNQLTKAYPTEVEHVDDNTVKLTWSSPRRGLVNFSAL